jgi:hypothetical protein
MAISKFWKGEISDSKTGEVKDFDFPARDNKEQALRDASDRVEEGESACACEWEGEDGDCINTGEVYEGDE